MHEECEVGMDLLEHMHRLLHKIIQHQGTLMGKQQDALAALGTVESNQAKIRADLAQLALDMQQEGDAAFQPFIDRLNVLAGAQAVDDASIQAADQKFKPVVNSITVSPAAINGNAGDTQTLTVSAVDQFGQPITSTPTFQVDNPAVATVDTSGIVTLVATGTAVVTVSAGTVSAAPVNVTVA
jgi:hypothetical protein